MTLVALWSFSLWAIGRLPGRVPMHWNLAGEVDGWGTPRMAALVLPALATVVYLLILGYDWGGLDFKAARAMSAATTRQVRLLVLLLLGGLHGSILWTSMHGGTTTAGRLMLILALFYILLGNLLPRLEPNAWAGIRIPPTLEDREVWKRTHRLCGKGMVLAGLAGIPSSFLPERLTTGMTLLLLCAPLVVAMGYAYWLRHRMEQAGIHPSEGS